MKTRIYAAPAVKELKLVTALKGLRVTSSDFDSLSITLAQISLPIPHCGHPPSTLIRWFVFMTDLMMASSSSGLSERRLITSHSTPCWAISLAASRQKPTLRECDTRVQWFPGTHNQFIYKLWSFLPSIFFRYNWNYCWKKGCPFYLLTLKVLKYFCINDGDQKFFPIWDYHKCLRPS